LKYFGHQWQYQQWEAERQIIPAKKISNRLRSRQAAGAPVILALLGWIIMLLGWILAL